MASAAVAPVVHSGKNIMSVNLLFNQYVKPILYEPSDSSNEASNFVITGFQILCHKLFGYSYHLPLPKYCYF